VEYVPAEAFHLEGEPDPASKRFKKPVNFTYSTVHLPIETWEGGKYMKLLLEQFINLKD